MVDFKPLYLNHDLKTPLFPLNCSRAQDENSGMLYHFLNQRILQLLVIFDACATQNDRVTLAEVPILKLTAASVYFNIIKLTDSCDG